MNEEELYALADEEARRLIETVFSFSNPYTCIIESDNIPFNLRDVFYDCVEEILEEKGYHIINRLGPYFKVKMYNV